MTSGGGTRTISAVAPSTSTCCSSSRDLSDEWRRCCTGVLFPGLASTLEEFEHGASASAGGTSTTPEDRGLIGRDDGTPGRRRGEDDCDFNDDGEIPVINLLDLPGEEEEVDYSDDRDRPSVVAADADAGGAGTGTTSTDANSNWYDNAALLYDSIADVSDLLRRKGRDYADCDFRLTTTTTGGGETRMTEAERVLLETTVMSFAASTATQIDLLRKQHEEIQKHRTGSTNGSTTSTFGGDEDMHRSGIVAVLLDRLKRDVALPMERLQGIRRREANVSRRNPLTCGVAPEVVVRKQPQRPADILLDEDDEEDTRHGDGRRREVIASAMEAASSSTRLLTDRTREEDEEFFAAYLDDDDLTDVNFLEDDGFDDSDDVDGPMKRRKTGHEEAAKAKEDSGFRPVVENVEYNTTYHEFEKNREQKRREEEIRGQRIPQQQPQPQQPQVFEEDDARDDPYGGDDPQRHVVEELRAEHLLLEAQFHDGELENVQRIEERMVEITTLLNRFTDLISEQREDVLLLHENTKRSTTNMEKGEGKLEEARERGRKSRHYMAKIIVFLAVLLLFLNWVTP